MTTSIKLINVGESKTGKTGALASLAKAGYHLWILDFDNGVEILERVLAKSDPEAWARITTRVLRDPILPDRNGIPKVGRPTAYKRAGETLMEWDAPHFGPSDIIVVDTLTTLSEAAFNEALQLGGRLNQRPQLQDYGWLGDSVKLFIDMLTSDSFPCHVIVNSHIKYLSGDSDEQTTTRGLPYARGQMISSIVSRYFNSVVLTRSVGSGPATKRIISTQPRGTIEVATSSPFTVEKEYSVEDGLAKLFFDILGHGPQPRTQVQPTKATKEQA